MIVPTNPHSIVSSVEVILHSPNSLPSITTNEAFTIRYGQKYQFDYSELSQRLLGQGFDTDCLKYDLDYKHANFNMNSDCVQSCAQHKLSRYFNQTNKIYRNYGLIRREFIEQNQNYSLLLDVGYWMLAETHLASCMEKCNEDCVIRKYILGGLRIDKENFYPKTIINIVHSRYPDILIVHVESMTWISLVCNVGGLIGMWLGYSILFVCEQTITLMVSLFKDRIKITFVTINNNVNLIQSRG